MKGQCVMQIEDDLREMLIYAFRYCLGRRSYAVSSCVTVLIRYWDQLPRNDKQLIHREIYESFRGDRYGMEMDKDQWKKILRLKLGNRLE